MRGDKQVFPHTVSSTPLLSQVLLLCTFTRLNLAFADAFFYNGSRPGRSIVIWEWFDFTEARPVTKPALLKYDRIRNTDKDICRR